MPELTREEIVEDEEEIERKINEIKDKRGWARRILDTNFGDSEKDITKAYRKWQLEWAIDKWKGKQKISTGRDCKVGNCGYKPHDKNDLWFHSQECKNAYRKILKNYKLGEHAYNLLTGKGNFGGDNNDQPSEQENCSRCGKKYFFNTRFKEFRKGKGENEYYHFCSEKCYNCFAICDNCGKIEKLNDNEIRQNIWKEKGWGSSQGKIFCSAKCHQELEKDPTSLPNCEHCGEKMRINGEGNYTVYSYEGRDEKFCSAKCREEWGGKNLNQQGNIPETQEETAASGNGNRGGGTRNGGNGSGDNSKSNSDNDNNQKGNEETNNDSSNNIIQEIATLSLPQAKAKAKTEIKKLLRVSSLSEAELGIENWPENTSWESYLDNLSTSQEVAEFTKKMQQVIAKKALDKQAAINNQKNPKNDRLLPVIVISLLILLVLTTLVIIIRKRKKKGL